MKPCLECNTENDDASVTCSACGGGSFQHVLDAETDARNGMEANANIDRMLAIDNEMRVWDSYDAAELEARWSRGERPSVQCAACPKIGIPCLACWVRANLRAEDYPYPAAAPPALETQPGGVDTESPPPPTPENVATEIDEAVRDVASSEPLEMSTHPSDPPGNGHDGDQPDTPPAADTSAPATKRGKRGGR